jgi:hypothetical protein
MDKRLIKTNWSQWHNMHHEEDEHGKMRSDLRVEDEHDEVEAQRVEDEHGEL